MDITNKSREGRNTRERHNSLPTAGATTPAAARSQQTPETVSVETGSTELESPFARNSRTLRSPPMQTAMETIAGAASSPEEQVTDDNKRKRKESDVDKDVEYLKEILRETVVHIKELTGLVLENANTKREVKTKTAILETYANRLDSERVKDLLDRCSKSKMARTESEKKSTGTQYQREYRCSVLKEGNPLKIVDTEWDVAVWRHTTDEDMTKGIQGMFKDKYPEILQTTEEIGHIKTTTWVYNKGESVPLDRHIFRLDATQDNSENAKRLEQVRDIMLQQGRRKLAIAWDDIKQIEQLRDDVESVLQKTDIMAAIHLPLKGIQASLGTTITTTQARRPENNQVDRQRRTAPQVITIKKTEANSYAKTLKDIKEELIGKGLEGNVHAVRETKKGDILITLGKTDKGNDQVKAALTEKMGKGNVRMSKSQDEVTFMIKGIDAITTKEDVIKTIQKQTGTDTPVNITSLRPGFAGTLAAVVTVGKDTASKLRGLNQLKIGLPNCTIKERVNIENCYKCWGTGHAARDCTGPDRSKACRNCGLEGHEKSSCTNPSKCVVCGGGHPANTTRCASFRAEIRKASGKREETPRKRSGWTSPTTDEATTPNAWQTQRSRKSGKDARVQLVELTPKRLEELKGSVAVNSDDITKRRWESISQDNI